MKLSEYIKEFGDKNLIGIYDKEQIKQLSGVGKVKYIAIVEEDKVFVPKENEKYYYVNDFGDVDYYNNDSEADIYLMNYQQVYRTEVEAEFARDKAIFLEFMRKEFLRNSDVIDWGDKDQTKYYTLWNCLDRETIINHSHVLIRNDFYTTDENWLDEFTNEHRDNIKKYYFEVEV